MKPFNVDLYGRPGCCLCDRAAELLQSLQGEFPHHLRRFNIDDDAQLSTKWCCHIPVVFVDGSNRVALRINEERLRRAFSRALRQRDATA